MFSKLKLPFLLTLIAIIWQLQTAQAVCLPPQTFTAVERFSGVSNCGERARQERNAIEACTKEAKKRFGEAANIRLLRTPPEYVGDSDQREVCTRRVGVCVDWARECSGSVRATCSVEVCF